MEIEKLVHYLDHPEDAAEWFTSWGVQDTHRAHANLTQMAASRISLDLLASMCEQLAEHLPSCPDADMALNNLERFLTSRRNPLVVAGLFDRDRQALPILIQIFSTSQYFSDLLITDPGAYELLRMTEGQTVTQESLIQELDAEIMSISTPTGVADALRRFKRREMLRIGYGDIVKEQPLETVTAQISRLAEAMIEAAVRASRFELEQKIGVPETRSGEMARYVILGLGKLGGEELNYSSDIDLICLYQGEGQTNGPRQITNREFFTRLTRQVVKYLSEVTSLGQAYRVDLRLRPHGAQGAIVVSVEEAHRYYDSFGRTWERQAYVKARPVAGDLILGNEFLNVLETWIYRKYLTLADITGIKALKRRIEKRTLLEGNDRRNVKTGHGGIRDVEFVLQFLQLLNGADDPHLRDSNTIRTLSQLEKAGCLTNQERGILEENYRFLRKVEHRLQFMFDLQTHLLPEKNSERRKLALRMGYQDKPEQEVLEQFEHDLDNRTAVNRKILDHLLHEAFPDDPNVEPEVDLVLDPEPDQEKILQVMGRYPFQDPEGAYRNLMRLASEQIRWLSPRRCRMFLASISPRLLEAIAHTVDPDQTLTDLEKVSASLGGKAVLWELFRFNPPSLRLYVELCASSPFLSQILVSNPGMIDELMDSLVLDKLPERNKLRLHLEELTRHAEDIEPILHSFKNSQMLSVGVRDILDKEPVEAITETLSDIAQLCLEQVVTWHYPNRVEKYGEPMIKEGPHAREVSGFAIVGMGKFGGRELSYHSDLDMIFLYEGDGSTDAARSRSRESTINSHFFGEVAQRMIKFVNHLGPYGRLYEIDSRLRPTGKSGPLATSLTEFERYFFEGEGQLWERQALCKARVVYASTDRMREATEASIHRAIYCRPWQDENAAQIRDMRERLQKTTSGANVKRGAGGIVDIEFLVQMLQLRHGEQEPALNVPCTLTALQALFQAGHINEQDFLTFGESYRFLRKIEARLRLMNPMARDELPEKPAALTKLARQLGYESSEAFLEDCNGVTHRTRERFNEWFESLAEAK
ncbi:Bifunctional glutamine synthetase adenylyltransferase/adenylyl-removing enzyme [Planctomycetales bacterium 10988]|nr:Bifunctional glutamine synthetase adenylyltransferase/adenylyl-removing enzyme [Planctomycetales bacterium 10988]